MAKKVRRRSWAARKKTSESMKRILSAYPFTHTCQNCLKDFRAKCVNRIYCQDCASRHRGKCKKFLNCKVCKMKFVSERRWQICKDCRNRKVLCACNCGEKIPCTQTYVYGHSSRVNTKKSAAWLARGRNYYWANLTKKEKERKAKALSIRTKHHWKIGSYADQPRKLRTRWENLSEKERAKLIRTAREATKAKPNNPEKKLATILDRFFPRQFRLNVSGKIVVNGRVPDFVHAKKKVLVEMFGHYWHGEFTGVDERKNEKARKAYFQKSGFNTAVIWENDLKDEQLVKKKVLGVMQ